MLELNRLYHNDCLFGMKELDDCSVDSIITDPPYGLSFMNKHWDYDIPSVEHFNEMFRVLKPGGFLLCFGGTRTWHRIAVNIEDAGFEIRDTICWLYGSGFPKSYDISKGIDKDNGKHNHDLSKFGNYVKECREAKGLSRADLDKLMGTCTAVSWWEGRKGGVQLPSKKTYVELKKHISMDSRFDSLIDWVEAEREVIGKHSAPAKSIYSPHELSKDVDVTIPSSDNAKLWDGWGTGLKPAFEPVIVAMKPVEKNFVNNALRYGVSGLNINGGRIGCYTETHSGKANSENNRIGAVKGYVSGVESVGHDHGRFPSNVIIDEEVAILLDEQSGISRSCGGDGSKFRSSVFKSIERNSSTGSTRGFGDVGGASRFFYCAKASKNEREKGLNSFEDMDTRFFRSHNGGGEPIGISKTYPDGSQRPTNTRKNFHPTVKPLSLMRYLCKLTKTPTAGIVLDPFSGSGTTLIAAYLEGRTFIGFELEKEYYDIAVSRLKYYMKQQKLESFAITSKGEVKE